MDTSVYKVPPSLPWCFRWLAVCLQCRRRGFNAWLRKIPWRRKWQPTQVFLPGESHGQRSLEGCSPWGRKESDRTERLTRSLQAAEEAQGKRMSQVRGTEGTQRSTWTLRRARDTLTEEVTQTKPGSG